jgi:c-di-AMP phosphodiesterase-like protein
MIAAVRHHHICVDTASFMMVVMQRLRELWLGQVWIDHHRCGKDGTASTLLGSSQPPSASA